MKRLSYIVSCVLGLTACGSTSTIAVDDAYISKLYDDVTSLYRLNLEGTGAEANARQELGPLPKTSVILLSSLAAAWVLIAVYFCITKVRKKR